MTGENNLPKSKRRTPDQPPTHSLLLSRSREQIHVRLDVNVVGYRVDALEWVCHLPIEVPDQLRE
jgi:hypothetical protein